MSQIFCILLSDLTYFHFLQCIATIIILCIGEMHNLINYVSFINYLSYGVTIAGLLYLRKKSPHLPRPIKVHKPENQTASVGTIFTLCSIKQHVSDIG